MGELSFLLLGLGNMNNLSPDQAQRMFDSVNGFLVVFGIIVVIVKIAFVVLLFVLVIKAIQYFNNKNKHDCSTCIYKQQYDQQNYSNFPFKDG